MKQVKFLVTLLFFLPAFSWGFLSAEEAAQRVRQFEGDNGLLLKYLGVDRGLSEDERKETSTPLPWGCYVFETNYPTPALDKCYYVDPFTGQIILWIDRTIRVKGLKRMRDEASKNKGDMVSPQQAYISAINFIQSHYPGFNPMGYEVYVWKNYLTEDGGNASKMVPYTQDLTWEKYQVWISFSFLKVVGDAQGEKIIDPGEAFYVDIDSETGEVFKCLSRQFPLQCPPTFNITREQAEQIALGVFHSPPFSPYVSYAEVEKAGKSFALVDVPPNCFTPVWIVDVNTYSNNEEYQNQVGAPYDPYGWYVGIDANSGEVYEIGAYLGAVGDGVQPTEEKIEKFKKAPKVEIPIRIKKDERPFLMPVIIQGKFYLKGEQCWLLGVVLEEKGKDVYLCYNNTKEKLTLSEFQRKDGKIYVSLESALKIAGYSYKYVPKERAIYIEKISKKKQKEGAIAGGLSLSVLVYAIWKFLKS